MLRRATDAIRSAGALGPLALFTVGMPAAAVPILAATHEQWLPVMRDAGLPFLPWYVLLGAALAGLSLVPTHAVSLVAGLLFGAGGGSAVALFAVLLGAGLGYGIVRRVVGDRLLAGLDERPRASAVHRALLHSGTRRAIGLIVLVRLSPVMPFAATNLLFASAGVGWRTFLTGSAFGLAPRVIAVAVLGAGLSAFDLSTSPGRAWTVAGLAITVVSLVVIGRWARRALDDELRAGAGAA